jgi:hypothetical protein
VFVPYKQSDQKFEKMPNFWKSSQTCSQNITAQIDSSMEPLWNIKIRTTNHVLKLLIEVKTLSFEL